MSVNECIKLLEMVNKMPLNIKYKPTLMVTMSVSIILYSISSVDYLKIKALSTLDLQLPVLYVCQSVNGCHNLQ